ncbi:MAG: hydroxyacid dehydrogenase [Eubacteriales bacterium]
MNLLMTVPVGGTRDRYIPPHLMERFAALGSLQINPYSRQYTRDELKILLGDTDIVITHWGSTQYDEELLACAPRLKLLAHCAGTVAHIASEGFYTRGIRVLSANAVMAQYVAEGALGYILAGLRGIAAYDRNMRAGGWREGGPETRSLIGAHVGMVGLGTVGRNLLGLLAPFSCRVTVYDPYLPDGALDAWPFAEQGTLAQVMACEVVTVHAAQTPETYHMIGAEALARMPDDALLVNTARGSVIDTDALCAQIGRIRAVLDVYEHEGVPQDDALLSAVKTVTLQPHLAGMPSGPRMTEAILCDIERFLRGEPTSLHVSHEQYLHMTQE